MNIQAANRRVDLPNEIAEDIISASMLQLLERLERKCDVGAIIGQSRLHLRVFNSPRFRKDLYRVRRRTYGMSAMSPDVRPKPHVHLNSPEGAIALCHEIGRCNDYFCRSWHFNDGTTRFQFNEEEPRAENVPDAYQYKVMPEGLYYGNYSELWLAPRDSTRPLQRVFAIEEDGLINAFDVMPDGTIYVALRRTIQHIHPDGSVRVVFDHSASPEQVITILSADANRGIYFLIWNTEIGVDVFYYSHANATHHFVASINTHNHVPFTGGVDAQGNFYFTSDNTLFWVHHDHPGQVWNNTTPYPELSTLHADRRIRIGSRGLTLVSGYPVLDDSFLVHYWW